MTPTKPHSTRGSVVLTALCLIAVLGIALATYLSISRQSLQLSDRSFRANATVQLAELGIERALAAFNSNDWTGWTLSGTTATRSYTGISSGTVGVTGTVNVRVTNYDTFTRGSTWSSTAVYQTYDLVYYNGSSGAGWYRCLTPHTGRTPPNLNYWVPEGVAWEWSPHTAYRIEDMVYRNGSWYRCTSAHTNQAPPNGSYWYQIPANAIYTETSYTSTTGCILNYYGTWYTWTGSSWSTTVPTSWRWRTSYAYSFNDVVCYSNVWYRCILAHTSQTPTNTTYWRPVSYPWTWSSSATYYPGDVAYSGSNWYRCLVKHSNQSPTNTTYWATTPPPASYDWNANAYYPQNHIVKRGSIWYRCITSGGNSDRDPALPANASHWTAASTTWSATNAYAAGDYVSFGGIWYRCRAPHTNQQPGLETYWQAIGDFVTTPVIVSEGLTESGNTADSRTQLRATVGRAPLFPNAIAASSTVSLNNSNSAGLVDSYDASVGSYASQTPGYSAIIAGGNTTSTAILVSGGTYKGYFAAPASTNPPYAPSVLPGGSVNLTGSSATGWDISRVSRNPNIPDFEIHSVPSGTALPTSSGWPTGGIAIGTPGGISPTVYTYSGALDLNATNEILTIRGPVILNIVGELRVRSSGRIILTSTGSAEIHFDSRLRIETTGAINNQTLDPKKLTLLSDMTSGSGSNTITTSTALYGTIYLPNATNALTFDTNSPGFYGAVSAKNVTFNAYANLHYDTSLRTAATSGVDAPLQALSLRQLTGPTDADWVTF